uniref:NADH dehydrogenase subunit 4L n=1 Tax=Polyrhachis dives TaxID=84555 RepID=A0A0A0RW07_9HYME|nr:NADH dehydrogenase subunit 4L [Polyrhachis dives]
MFLIYKIKVLGVKLYKNIMIDLLIYMYLCIIILNLMIFTYKFMLVVLMMIELMILNISMIMFLVFSFMNLELYMIYYLVFMVCESTLGLSLLVVIVRFSGNELFYVFNLSKF